MNSLSLLEEKNQQIELATLAVDIVLSRFGIIKDEISQREAFRLFDEARVRTWVNKGLVKFVRGTSINSPHTYSRIELETIKRLEATRKIK
jgi:hypothetical protein